MFEKYKALSEAYEMMYKLANEVLEKMLDTETLEELNLCKAKHEAFMEAATAIHEMIMKTMKQAK